MYAVRHKHELFNRLDRACLLLSSDATYEDIATEAKCSVNDVAMYIEHRIAELNYRKRCAELHAKLEQYCIANELAST